MEKRENAQVLKLLLPYAKWIIFSVVVSLGGVGTSLLSPLIMKWMLDVAIPEQNAKMLFFCIAGLVLLPIFSTVLGFVEISIHNRIGGEVTDRLWRELFAKVIRLSPRTLNDFNTGNITSRIDRTFVIGDIYLKLEILPAFAEGMMFIGLLIMMFYLHWQLALFSIAMLPITIAVTHRLGKKLKQAYKKESQLHQELSSYSVQLIGGMKTVQMMTREKKERQVQEDWLHQFRQLRNRTFQTQMWQYNLLGTLEQALGLGLLFSFGIWAILKGKMTVGTLLAYTVYFPKLFSSVKRLRDAYIGWKEAEPKLEQNQEILQLPIEVQEQPDAISLTNTTGRIEFQNISFCYKEDRGQLKNISFDVKPGEMIGIVGPSGAGKSTILDLLLRFYDPDEGKILLDGRDLKEYKLHDLRNCIGLVTQEVFLWDKTIKENLLYAKPDATLDEIRKVCEIAQMTDFIEQMPQGLDTLIGERGVKISGGEKQRLGIARILLRQPQILLMDEPTSALDAKTEALLHRELEKIFAGKTVMVVAHRLATIRNADRIIVVKDGTIAEIGTHDELMQNQSVYYQLYTEQFHPIKEKAIQ